MRGRYKNFDEFLNSLPFLPRFVGYQLRELNVFLSYISRLEGRKKLPPGKEKNGLKLAARMCDAEWVFSQMFDACRAVFYSQQA